MRQREKCSSNESYLKEHPDHEEGVKKLRLLIEEQVREGGREGERVSEERCVNVYLSHNMIATCSPSLPSTLTPPPYTDPHPG